MWKRWVLCSKEQAASNGRETPLLQSRFQKVQSEARVAGNNGLPEFEFDPRVVLSVRDLANHAPINHVTAVSTERL